METNRPQPSLSTKRLNADMVALRPRLVAHARRIAGDRLDPEDLVQTAFTRALERRQILAADSDLRAWMNVVIRNIAIDEHRRHKVERLDDGAADTFASAEPEPVADWKQHDLEEIKGALAGCTPSIRRTFELFYFEGLTLAAIAKAMSVPVATVGVRIFRARRKIRSAVSPTPVDSRPRLPKEARAVSVVGAGSSPRAAATPRSTQGRRSDKAA
jgi:RNA polymerase sigma-70 factor (ECF subfamily)